MISWLWRAGDRLRHESRKRTWNAEQASGRRGEDLAHRFLQRSGFVVVARNYRMRSGAGEIDLIAWEHDRLVFVEVKSRSSVEFGSPDRNVDQTKRVALMRAARDYAARAGVGWERVRFDLVSIVLSEPVSIRHTREAFPIHVQPVHART